MLYDNANQQAKAEEWTQNFILDAKSGFTQGTVGFGIDGLGLYSQKLDGGKGTAGTQLPTAPRRQFRPPEPHTGRPNVAAVEPWRGCVGRDSSLNRQRA